MKLTTDNRQPTTTNLVSFLILLLVVGSLLLVHTPRAHAQTFNLIVCGTDKNNNTKLDKEEECTFNDLITLAQNLINALIIISTFLATAAFAYAGLILLTSGGSESKRDKAKEIFTKVLIGYLWILGAWLLVYTITSVLLNQGFSLLGAPK